ncbi:hypothetical protein [Mycobacterium sp.]|uniref:hypothetical protein n=1 Tax=Mycobacterium sp. TaxID=1785 RepID=UPI002C7EC3C3|nr:hypothetical protein [Mycobacterium sp.]HKP42107.1 hypothetical protein [Mycobacterium sp.]
MYAAAAQSAADTDASEQAAAKPAVVVADVGNASGVSNRAVTSSATQLPTGTGSPSPQVQLLAVSTAATSDPAWDAYVQQFRNADPTGKYWTPASSDYTRLYGPQYPNPADYAAFIQRNVDQYGTAGFSRTSSGNLQYTNAYNQNVAVLYGPRADVNPDGIRIVKPGQTVVLPSYPDGGAAEAELPRRSPTDINIVGLAAPGHPQGGSTGGGGSSPIHTYPSASPLITSLNQIFQSSVFGNFVSRASDLAAIIGVPVVSNVLNFAGGFIAGYNGDAAGALFKSTGALGDGLAQLGASTRNPLLYLGGIATSTWSYTFDQAAHADFSDPGSTARYALSHPVETVVETVKATGQVVGHIGSTVIGSLGGLLKFKWPF